MPLSKLFYLRLPLNPLGLRVWNYNKSLEDTSRGIKAVQLFLDGKPLSPLGGHLIAKAPGNDAYDFGQFIPLHPGLLEGGSGSPESRGASIYSAGMEASAWIGAMADPVAAMRIWSAARRGKSHCGMVRQVEQPHLTSPRSVPLLTAPLPTARVSTSAAGLRHAASSVRLRAENSDP